MDKQKIFDGLEEAVTQLDQPAIILVCIGTEGESFIVDNEQMAELTPMEKSEVFCGANIALTKAILLPEEDAK